MRLTRRSVFFLVIAFVLAVLNLLDLRGGTVEEKLPSLPGVVPETVAVVQISTPIEKLRMERVSTVKGHPQFDQWRLVTPLQFPADGAQIRTILRVFAAGLPMDAFVDEGNHEDYGVDDQNGRLVELWRAGEEEPAVSLVIGKPAAGPTAFVRIPGSPNVYRADVDGQARYVRPASDWRDKVAIDLQGAEVDRLRLARGAEVLSFVRGPSTGVDDKGKPKPGDWTLEGGDFVVDTETVDAAIHVLSRVRSGEIHNADYAAGFEAPAAVATLTTAAGTESTITLGGRLGEGASFIKVSGRDEVFRVAENVGRVMLLPRDGFRDRRLLSFDRADVASMVWADRGLTVVLEQGDGDSWVVTQPANMDADQRLAISAVNTLASLRAAAIAPDPTFHATGARFEVRFRDGRSQVLELGQTERDTNDRPMVRVRVKGKDGVFQLAESTVKELLKAFGRA